MYIYIQKPKHVDSELFDSLEYRLIIGYSFAQNPALKEITKDLVKEITLSMVSGRSKNISILSGDKIPPALQKFGEKNLPLDAERDFLIVKCATPFNDKMMVRKFFKGNEFLSESITMGELETPVIVAL